MKNENMRSFELKKNCFHQEDKLFYDKDNYIPVCEPHACRCGANVNTLGLRNLACRFSAGRLVKRAELNEVVKRALHTSGLSCPQEPHGLSRDDGRKPDDITMFAHKHGKVLWWDYTCVYTFASTHVNEIDVQIGFKWV